MEDWPKNLFTSLEQITAEMERFFQDMTEIWEVVAQEVQNSIATEVEYLWQDLCEPLADFYTEFDLEINAEFDDFSFEEDSFFSHKIDSTWEHHPACRGCSHYHGQVYNGNLLVCAMHPYGWEEENCPDWEQ